MNRLLVATLIASMACASAAPPVIDDMMLVENFTTSMGKLVGTEGVPSADELCAAAKESSPRKAVAMIPEALKGGAGTPENDYDHLSKSVFMLGTVYKCGKCSNWHRGGNATAWCLSSDGLMVTNAHVFLSVKGEAMGVSDREGHCYPVTGLVGLDVLKDVAIFRVNGKGLQALRLGAPANVGDPVTIISNPAGNNFMRTSGTVARYVNQPVAQDNPVKVVWMCVTAEYAGGSSGGPLFNAAGEVVGMVSKTHSLYTGGTPKDAQPKGELQMVIRNCVPGEAIRSLFEGPAAAGQAEAPK